MWSRADFLKSIRALPAQTPLFPDSQQQNWIRWLEAYEEYPRKNANRNAEFIFNALNNPNYIIWLAASAGVNPALVKTAIKKVRSEESKATQASEARSVLSWRLVAEHLQRSRSVQKERSVGKGRSAGIEAFDVESLNGAAAEFQSRVQKSLRDAPGKRRRRLSKAPRVPKVVIRRVREFVRNPDVVAEVLFRAKGTCCACKRSAPFSRSSDQTPYLEVHHKLQLSAGGEDTVKNAIALCPNCHRKAHFG